tara:strand:- start:147 stop:584 length:438 start_codon:yes stop_codon:yes gene_type:complete
MAKRVRTKQTKISKKQKVKKRLKKELALVKTRKYKTTYKDIKKYFNLINTHVFDGKLAPFNEILIKDLARQNCIGQVVTWTWKRKGTQQFWLEMLPTYKDKKEFVDTLAHECIHLFQMANMGDSGNHNTMFYSFRPKLNAIGLDI